MKNIESVKDIIFLVSNVMEGYSVALFVADNEKENSLRLFCYDSFSKNIDENCRVDRGEGLISWVYREQKFLVVNNFDNDTSTLRFYTKNEEIKSFMAVPLPDRKGVLCVDSKKSYIFTEEKEKILKQISIIIAKYITRIGIEEDKINLKRIIECSLKIDDSIFFIYDTKEKIYNLFKIIYSYFNTIIIMSYVVYNKEYIFSFVDNVFNFTITDHDPSENNIISICTKNKKTIYRNKIKTNVSLRIDRQKTVTFDNYLCIPLYYREKTEHGCLFFSKNGKLSWEKGEVQFLERVARKIFMTLSRGNGGTL